MKTINLKEFYPSLYGSDCFCSVTDEVAELMIEYRKKERAQREYIRRHRAYFSLNCEDGIEKESMEKIESAEDVYVHIELLSSLICMIETLTAKQRRRLYANVFLEMSYSEIARVENVDESAVRRSVISAIEQLRKINIFLV